MGYKSTVNVTAERVEDLTQVTLHLRNLHLFSSGAFSNVYRGMAEEEKTGASTKEVVVKKTWTSKRSSKSPPEVNILKLLNRLSHKNIVRLLYSYCTEYSDNSCFSLVFEFIPLNLYQYLKQKNRRIELIETKMFTWQLFRGQHHLLKANICHRDIKPQNLLVEADSGLLKISDFGSSTTDPLDTPQHSYHVTRYYRPPELLLGSKHYGCEIDIWSSACVFGEMLKGSILFPGKDTDNQLQLVLQALGMPKEEDAKAMRTSKSKWKEAKSTFRDEPGAVYPQIAKLLPIGSSRCSPQAVKLLEGMLKYDPYSRLHGYQLLTNSFFHELFAPEAKRPDGRRIECLGKVDYDDVLNGGVSMTGSISTSASIEVGKL